MTPPPPLPRLLLGVALLVGLGVPRAHAQDAAPSSPAAPSAPAPAAAPPPPPAKPPLPEGVLARVGDRDVRRDAFLVELTRRVRKDLDDPSSGPYTVLQILIQEAVVLQEAERLGIRVTTEDYGRRFDQIDREVRLKSGGSQTLEDVIKQQKMTPAEFRTRLEDQVRKERIAGHPSYLGNTLPTDEGARLAQVEVVIGQLLSGARIERTGLPAGVMARVNGQAIDEARLGSALYTRLAESEVRRHLQEHCLILLLDREGLDFPPAQVDEVLEADRPLYDRMRAEALSPEKQGLSFDDFVLLRYGAPRAELRASRYRRGLFALRQKLSRSIPDDAVRAAWVRGSEAEYGPSFIVTEILISFQIPKAVVEHTARRTREEALRIAHDYLRRLRGGESVDVVLKEIRDRKDRSIVGERRGVIRRGNDLQVFEAVAQVSDGTWLEPVETLSEFHVLRREAMHAAPAWKDIEGVVRANLVDQKAQVWIQEALRDEVQVAK